MTRNFLGCSIDRVLIYGWFVLSLNYEDSVDFLVRIGDQRHVMTYIIGAGKSFNMVLSHPDHSDPSTWDQATALADMRREFQGWDGRYASMYCRLFFCLLILSLQTAEDHRAD
jgi:hypothetical protein